MSEGEGGMGRGMEGTIEEGREGGEEREGRRDGWRERGKGGKGGGRE